MAFRGVSFQENTVGRLGAGFFGKHMYDGGGGGLRWISKNFASVLGQFLVSS